MSSEVKVMVVEDNPGDIKLIQEHLKEIDPNCQFRIYTDGDSALEYLFEIKDNIFIHLPDLIILDINLPKKSGLEVLNFIKKHEALRTIPTVIFSSSSASEDIRQAYDLQANCYFVKPFDLDEYRNIIQKIWEFWFGIAKLPRENE
jgi:CheY-like chemotaxis protein